MMLLVRLAREAMGLVNVTCLSSSTGYKETAPENRDSPKLISIQVSNLAATTATASPKAFLKTRTVGQCHAKGHHLTSLRSA